MAAEPSNQILMQTMFMCMPLRLGTLVVSFLTFFTSFLYICNRSWWEHSFRYFTGGYTLSSRVFIGVTEFTGIVFGLVGMIGAWYQKRDQVIMFNVWQFVRLVAWTFMYLVDIPLITHCEDWVNNVEAMTNAHGWNGLLYEMAMAGRCGNERFHFFLFSSLTFLTLGYICHATFRYQDIMARVPKHLLRVPKDLSSGAFYAHSMGERAHLNGLWGKHDYNPAASGPSPDFLPPPSEVSENGPPGSRFGSCSPQV